MSFLPFFFLLKPSLCWKVQPAELMWRPACCCSECPLDGALTTIHNLWGEKNWWMFSAQGFMFTSAAMMMMVVINSHPFYLWAQRWRGHYAVRRAGAGDSAELGGDWVPALDRPSFPAPQWTQHHHCAQDHQGTLEHLRSNTEINIYKK